jgi:hypothetical protein
MMMIVRPIFPIMDRDKALQSLLGNFLGNSGGGSNQQQGKGGLLGDILGG